MSKKKQTELLETRMGFDNDHQEMGALVEMCTYQRACIASLEKENERLGLVIDGLEREKAKHHLERVALEQKLNKLGHEIRRVEAMSKEERKEFQQQDKYKEMRNVIAMLEHKVKKLENEKEQLIIKLNQR